MKTIFTFLIAVFCFCDLANADLKILLNGSNEGRPDTAQGEGDLSSIVRAAADTWEAIYAPDTSIDNFSLAIDYGWGDLDEGSLAFHLLTGQEVVNGIHRETSATITFDNSSPIGTVFADPTPFERTEYSSSVTGSATVNGERLVTSRAFLSGSGIAGSSFDLYSIALHEIGHALGLSSFNDEFIRETRTEGDNSVEVESPLPFAGYVIDIEDDNAHLDVGGRVLLGTTLNLGTRYLPSDLDILVNAQLNQFNAVDFSAANFRPAPVPEPSSLVLSLLLLPMVVRRRR